MTEDETGEGAEEPEAAETEPAPAEQEPAPAEEPEAAPASSRTVAPPAPLSGPPGAMHVAVQIGDNGEGSAFVGLDCDDCSLWGVPSDYSVGIMPAHTVGIARVLVSGAEPGSTVNVTVLPKK